MTASVWCTAWQGVFCMEGMWQRFFPASQALRALLRAGAIGQPLSVDARKTFLADEVRAVSSAFRVFYAACCSIQ